MPFELSTSDQMLEDKLKTLYGDKYTPPGTNTDVSQVDQQFTNDELMRRTLSPGEGGSIPAPSTPPEIPDTRSPKQDSFWQAMAKLPGGLTDLAHSFLNANLALSDIMGTAPRLLGEAAYQKLAGHPLSPGILKILDETQNFVPTLGNPYPGYKQILDQTEIFLNKITAAAPEIFSPIEGNSQADKIVRAARGMPTAIGMAAPGVLVSLLSGGTVPMNAAITTSTSAIIGLDAYQQIMKEMQEGGKLDPLHQRAIAVSEMVSQSAGAAAFTYLQTRFLGLAGTGKIPPALPGEAISTVRRSLIQDISENMQKNWGGRILASGATMGAMASTLTPSSIILRDVAGIENLPDPLQASIDAFVPGMYAGIFFGAIVEGGGKYAQSHYREKLVNNLSSDIEKDAAARGISKDAIDAAKPHINTIANAVIDAANKDGQKVNDVNTRIDQELPPELEVNRANWRDSVDRVYSTIGIADPAKVANAYTSLVDAYAKAQGLSTDEYLQNYYAKNIQYTANIDILSKAEKPELNALQKSFIKITNAPELVKAVHLDETGEVRGRLEELLKPTLGDETTAKVDRLIELQKKANLQPQLFGRRGMMNIPEPSRSTVIGSLQTAGDTLDTALGIKIPRDQKGLPTIVPMDIVAKITPEMNEKLRVDHGWWVQPNGKWSHELSDERLKLKQTKLFPGSGSFPLTDWIEHPTMTTIHPFLKNITIESTPGSTSSAFMGKNRILIAEDAIKAGPESFLDALEHEIHHLIADKEEFPQGGSPYIEKGQEVVGARKLLYEKGLLEDKGRDLLGTEDSRIVRKLFADETLLAKQPRNIREEMLSLGKKWRSLDMALALRQSEVAFHNYATLYGEAAARDTVYRRRLTAEQRLAIPPFFVMRLKEGIDPSELHLSPWETGKDVTMASIPEVSPLEGQYPWKFSNLNRDLQDVQAEGWDKKITFAEVNKWLSSAPWRDEELKVLKTFFHDEWQAFGDSKKAFTRGDVLKFLAKHQIGSKIQDNKIYLMAGEKVIANGDYAIRDVAIPEIPKKPAEFAMVLTNLELADIKGLLKKDTAENQILISKMLANELLKISSHSGVNEVVISKLMKAPLMEAFKDLGDAVEFKDMTDPRYTKIRFTRQLSDESEVFGGDQLFDVHEGIVAGVTRFLPNGKAIIALTKHADAATLLHEMLHVTMRHLPAEDRTIMEKWLGVKKGRWKFEHEEKAVKAWISYIQKGESPNKELEQVYKDMSGFVRDSMTALEDSDLKVDIPAEITSLYDTQLVQRPELAPQSIAQERSADPKIFKLKKGEKLWSPLTGEVNFHSTDSKSGSIFVQFPGIKTKMPISAAQLRRIVTENESILGPLEIRSGDRTTKIKTLIMGSLRNHASLRAAMLLNGIEPGNLSDIEMLHTLNNIYDSAIRIRGLDPKRVTDPNLLFSRDQAWLQEMRRLGEAAVKSPKYVSKFLWDWANTSIMDIVGNLGGPGGKEMAGLAALVMDRSKEYFGALENPLKHYLRMVSGGFAFPEAKKYRAAVFSLKQTRDYDGLSYTRNTLAIEGKLEKFGQPPLTKAEAEIIKVERAIISLIGKKAEDLGMMIKDQISGEYVPFKRASLLLADGTRVLGVRFPRMFTEDFYNLIRRTAEDSNSAAASILEELFVRTGITTAGKEARSYAKRFANSVMERHANLEFMREIEDFPSAFKTSTGNVIQLLRADPFDGINQYAQFMSKRLAFVEAFGQGIKRPGFPPPLYSQLIDKIADPQAKKYAIMMVQSLNGTPMHILDNAFTSPDNKLYGAYRLYRIAESLQITGLLSRAFIPNAAELLGNTQAFAGSGTLFRALMELAGPNRKDVLAEIMRLGEKTFTMAKLYAEPGRRPEGWVRMFREWGMYPFITMPNEAVETVACVSGLLKMRDLQAGLGTSHDRMTLLAMGYEEPLVEKMIHGEARTSEYEKFARDFPTFAQMMTAHPSEKSPLLNNRYATALLPFHTYITGKLDRTLKVWNVVQSEYAKGNQLAASTYLAKYILANVESGTAALFIRSWVLGGTSGLLTQTDEVNEQIKNHGIPWTFLADALEYTMLGGYADALYRTISMQDQYFLQNLFYAQPSISFFSEAREALKSTGRYQGMSLGEAMLQLLQNRFLITRPLATTITAYALDQDREMPAAIRRFHDWEKGNLYRSRLQTTEQRTLMDIIQNKFEEDRTFRINMHHFYQAALNNDNAAASESLNQALMMEGKAGSNLAASIRGKKLMRGMTPQDIDKMQHDIAPEIVNKIYQHDALLDAWADSIKGIGGSAESSPWQKSPFSEKIFGKQLGE